MAGKEHLNKPFRTNREADMWQRMSMYLVFALTMGACAQPGMFVNVREMYRTDLTEDLINRVAVGQTEQEVANLLSLPYRRIRFDNIKQTALDYRYKDTWGYQVDFSVMMGDNGLVVGKVSRRIDPMDNNK
jgi:hypothetical protein